MEGGSPTLNESLNWNGGTLKTNVAMSPGSSGTIQGSEDTQLDGAIHNSGTLTLASNKLKLANAALIENSGNGTFRIAKGSQVVGLVCCNTPAGITNTGSNARIEVASAPFGSTATTAVIDAVALNAAGTIDVGGGVLEVRWDAPSEIAAGTRFIGDGKFRVTNSAQIFMSGTFNVLPATEFELDRCATAAAGFNDPSLKGTGTMDGDGFFLWKGGDVDGQGHP